MRIKLFSFLFLVCLVAGVCLSGMDARADYTMVDNLPAGKSGTLNNNERMSINYGDLNNKGGFVDDNRGGILNYRTVGTNHGTVYNYGVVQRNEGGRVYMLGGQVVENLSGSVYYPIDIQGSCIIIAYDHTYVEKSGSNWWADTDSPAAFSVTPSDGYVITRIYCPTEGFKVTYQGDTAIIVLPAGRKKEATYISVEVYETDMPDNPAGASNILFRGRHMQTNYGTLYNRGILDLNMGVILNHSTGEIGINRGNVFMEGGTIGQNEGKVFYRVSVQSPNATVQYTNGYASMDKKDDWLEMGQAGIMKYIPNSGYMPVDIFLPDYVHMTENNGSWTLEIDANHPSGTQALNIPTIRIPSVADNPANSTVELNSGEIMWYNRGTVTNNGEVSINYGTVENYKGGRVEINAGTVYDYGGQIGQNDADQGTVYNHLYIGGFHEPEYGMFFETGEPVSYKGIDWVAQGKETIISIIYHKDPDDPDEDEYDSIWGQIDIPDWVRTERMDGYRLRLIIPANRPAGDIIIRGKNGPNVEDNPKKGDIKLYYGQIMDTNYGTLYIRSDAVLYHNEGKVKANYGRVKENLIFAIVKQSDGIVELNQGSVETNSGRIFRNDLAVGVNLKNGIVEVNGKNGTLMFNRGRVDVNEGEIKTNEQGGTVVKNNGRITEQNDGTVQTNSGTVASNTETGVIEVNRSVISQNAGIVKCNAGNVFTNTGTVENFGGTVSENTGTVHEHYSVGFAFEIADAVYSDNFTEFDGRYWLAGNETGIITFYPSEWIDSLNTYLSGADLSAVRNDNSSWTVTVTNLTGNIELKEAIPFFITATAEYGTIKIAKSSAQAGEPVTLTVTPESEDYHLSVLSVICGDEEVPTTEVDENTYTFVMPEGNVTARAMFVRNCLVWFVNWDHSTLQCYVAEAGQMPVYTGETPTSEPNEKYSFTFTGWTPELEPLPNDRSYVIYQAVYSAEIRSYPVQFLGDDGTVLQTGVYEYGTTPEYTGETPAKAADENYFYVFRGWDSEISPVNKSAVYRPLFDAIPILHLGENLAFLEKRVPKTCPFIPTKSGYYRLRSSGKIELVPAILTNEQGNRIDWEEMTWCDIDTDGLGNFEYLVYLEGGKAYSLKLEAFFVSGSVSVFVEEKTMHTVHYDQTVEHGAFFGLDQVWEGQSIAFEYEPDEGYGLLEMRVTDAQRNPLNPDPENPQFYFVGSSDVYVSGTFAPVSRIQMNASGNMLFNSSSNLSELYDEEDFFLFGAQGAMAEFTLMPDDGYTLDTLTLVLEDGSPVPFSISRPNPNTVELWFTVPAENCILTVHAGQACAVSFDPGAGSGSMDPDAAVVGKPYTLPDCEFTAPIGAEFAGWQMDGDTAQLKQPGDQVVLQADTNVTAIWQAIVFGTPDFILPAATIRIEEEAFEGSAMDIVYIPNLCTSIGAHAFRNCANLQQIRIPVDCAIGADAFEGCNHVMIFGAVGSAAEFYCTTHKNCTFVPENNTH